MDFETCFHTAPMILMEGALGERLKREYGFRFDGPVAMADFLYDVEKRQALRKLFLEYAEIAERYGLPFMATTPTRRANRERVGLAGYDPGIIGDNVRFLQQIRSEIRTDMYVGGLMGCKGDAYKAAGVLSEEEAFGFHSWQADLFKDAGADFLYAGIMPALTEAIGMARAMEKTGLPYIVSFMIRADGKLLDGTSIHDAIAAIDSSTDRSPLCYLTNCVHPTVLQKALECSVNRTNLVRERFRGIQANTSPLSPEELDNSRELKTSDSLALANDMMELFRVMSPKILGGCCGTDNSHIEEIAKRIRAVSMEEKGSA